MDFLKEFSKQFTNIARTATEKTREGAENNRLNAELRAAEQSLERLYNRFGKASYAAVTGEVNSAEVEELALRIRATRLQVEELTAARNAARELKRCLNCGLLYPREANYCSACGKKLPEDAPKPEPVEEGEYCPNCGAKRENEEPVCPVCGTDYAVSRPVPVPEPEPDPVPGPTEEPME